MPLIHPRRRPLAVSPIKTSAATGATLATLGVAGAVPLMHGAQGCAAFAKVFFVQHFREPIPLQTTAIDAVSAVMGGDGNITEALATVVDRYQPDLVTVITSGLTEMQGVDLPRVIKDARREHNGVAEVPVVGVNTPDFAGSFETGYAAAVLAILKAVVRPKPLPQRRPGQINLLLSAALTAADVQWLKDLVASFGLQAIVLPDLSLSLDGHLDDAHFSPRAVGGTTVLELAEMGASRATLVVGESLRAAGDWLGEQFAMPVHHFAHLGGMAVTDQLVMQLAEWSGHAVPVAVDRARRRYQDALLDAHFVMGGQRVALAGEGDELALWQAVLADCGAQFPAALAPAVTRASESLAVDELFVSDLYELEQHLRTAGVDLVVANAHAQATATRLGVPLLRRGFPIYDRLGAADRLTIGYDGGRAFLFEAANLLLEHHEVLVAPHRSRYAPLGDQEVA